MTDNEHNDGGPAYPHTEENPNGTFNYNGMTLRDWFAGQALAGLLSHPDYDNTPDEDAKCAYEIADAMLVERGGCYDS